ncbi:crotonase/enoyl-CoA hydratase family protein [Georgenia sp. AZ-5]|uniref:crotonase/enoyl-CoA hydratase family protein n=1 Tax=Georgenia sp. AZ-5 TaxID=3367526 RepID=UPI00375441E3
MSPLLVEQREHVQTWTLNLPEQRNPISDPAVIGALETAAREASRDPDVRAVVLTGAGPAFSAGGNVKEMASRSGMFAGSAPALRESYRDNIQRIPRAMHALEVPVVAAVNGPAVGAGCDLALMCDLRIATPKAFFAESFVRLGLVPGDGGAWFLPRIVGAARAAEMALLGEPVGAEQAVEWGLISRVVEPDDLLPTALDLAARLAANPPHAVRMTKKLLREAPHHSLDSFLELTAAFQAVAHQAADHEEAVAALLEKRTGRYTGQ